MDIIGEFNFFTEIIYHEIDVLYPLAFRALGYLTYLEGKFEDFSLQ
jgi:hypothetical protein